MTAATKVQWRVQVRKSRAHKWVNKSGLFETRDAAREEAACLRVGIVPGSGYGFGNTRIRRYVKGSK